MVDELFAGLSIFAERDETCQDSSFIHKTSSVNASEGDSNLCNESPNNWQVGIDVPIVPVEEFPGITSGGSRPSY